MGIRIYKKIGYGLPDVQREDDMRIIINKRQVKNLLVDLKDMPEHEFVELHQLEGHGGGPPHRTVELRVPQREEGDFLFPDGTTGY